MTIRIEAARIIKHLERHGVFAEMRGSSLSESVYLECRTEDHVVRLRGSNHVAKPTYQAINGAADYEFGHHDEAQGDAISAVVWTLRAMEIEADATLRRILTNRQNKAAIARSAAAADAVSLAAFLDKQAAAEKAFIAWCGDRWTEANDPSRSAKSRKRARQKLRAQYEARG